jgi:peptidoglycan/LPS O-acetylase OafA/YrhL
MVTGAIPTGRPTWLMLGGIGLAVAFLSAMEISSIDCLRLGFAFGLAVMIVGFARWEQSVTPRWPTFLVLLGNASYSIYLVHNPVLSVAQRLSQHAGLHWISGLCLGVIMSVAAGYLYHVMLERRAVRFFGSRMERKSNQAIPGTIA